MTVYETTHAQLPRSVLFTLLVLLGFSIATWGQQTPDMGGVVMNSTTLDAARLAKVANDFRLDAVARGVNEAVENVAVAECANEWQEAIAALEERQVDLRRFFALSMITPGSLSGRRPIVGFYNPWVDIILLTEWEIRALDDRMSDFAFLPGELIRDDPLNENPAVLMWLISTQRSKETNLGEACAKTISAFQKRFPVHADAPPLKTYLQELPQPSPEELLTIIQLRSLLPEAYIARNFSPDVLAKVNNSLNDLLTILREGKQESLLAALSAKQDKYVAQTATMLPAVTRDSLSPQWYVRADNAVLVFLCSPISPRFFVSVRLDLGAPEKERTMYVYDFNVGLGTLGESERTAGP